MEVLYHIRPCFVGIFPYIGLIYCRYLHFRILKFPWPIDLPCLKIQEFKHKVCSHDQVLSRSPTLKNFEWSDIKYWILHSDLHNFVKYGHHTASLWHWNYHDFGWLKTPCPLVLVNSLTSPGLLVKAFEFNPRFVVFFRWRDHVCFWKPFVLCLNITSHFSLVNIFLGKDVGV